MSNYELMTLFSGYGYHPRIVDVTEAENPHQIMAEALEWSYQLIQETRNSQTDSAPRLPMIVMRTLKGWTGVKELDGRKIEGNHLSHQVVLKEAKTNEEQLNKLSDWLHSYKFHELFDKENGFGEYLESIFHKGDSAVTIHFFRITQRCRLKERMPPGGHKIL